jgi:hypothetical protein
MEQQTQEQQNKPQDEHKKKCAFCPMGKICPMSGKPSICLIVLIVVVIIIIAKFIFKQ